jgi:ligand-binding SRPBCC domain-containing protein
MSANEHYALCLVFVIKSSIMSSYYLERIQKLPISLETAWEFFSSPLNLQEITPKELNFNILNPKPGRMHAGQIIRYKVSPLLGIPVFWMTEITHVQELEYFVDEQRIGPYRLWHHSHFFKAIPGGVEMTDRVHYQLPLGFLGRLGHTVFIKKKLEAIFDYRYNVLKEKFGMLNT